MGQMGYHQSGVLFSYRRPLTILPPLLSAIQPQKHLKSVMSELGRRSWRKKKKIPKALEHLQAIASGGGKARRRKRMGQAFRPDPFECEGDLNPPDLLFIRQTLSQLSYRPINGR